MSVVYEGLVQSGTVRTNTPFVFGAAVPASTPDVSRFLTIETWATIDDYRSAGGPNFPTPTWSNLGGSYCYPDASLVQEVSGHADYPVQFRWSAWLAQAILPTSTLEFVSSAGVGLNDYDVNYVIRLWSHVYLVSNRTLIAESPFEAAGGGLGDFYGGASGTVSVTDAEYVLCSGSAWGFAKGDGGPTCHGTPVSPNVCGAIAGIDPGNPAFGTDQVTFEGDTVSVTTGSGHWTIFSGVDTCSSPSYSLTRNWSNGGDCTLCSLAGPGAVEHVNEFQPSLDIATIKPGSGIPCDKPSQASAFLTSTRQSRWPVSAG